jgi:hypothetical protein
MTSLLGSERDEGFETRNQLEKRSNSCEKNRARQNELA